jgi:glycosyltransferase involved in cell wall biosynthesis
MRVLLVPRHIDNIDSNEPIPNRTRLLSRTNEIVGVIRYSIFRDKDKPRENLNGALKFMSYGLKVLYYTLRNRNSFDLIYCFDPPYFNLLGVVISLLSGGKPCVRDCAFVTKEWCARLKIPRLLAFARLTTEKLTARFTRLYVVLSEVDKSGYAAQGIDPEKIAVIPRPPKLFTADEVSKYRKEDCRQRLGVPINKKTIIFTGKRCYSPNIKYARWINDELAPAIAQKFGDVQILITGTEPLPEPTHPFIKSVGYVEDYFNVIFAADICVIPNEMPTGRLTKAFDSMSCGIPTVMMTSAMNGIPELVDGQNAMVSKDKNEFISKTLYLLEHPAEAQTIGKNGKEMMDNCYSWTAWEDKLNQALEKCLKKKN